MPRLSILMPLHNAQQTVRSAVKSTLRAMPKDAELVVWNDGSTDFSSQVIASISDHRLRVHNASANAGVATSLSALLQSTDSEYVARMDADDICLPHRFRQGINALGKGNVVLFNTTIRFTSKKILPLGPFSISARAAPLLLLLVNPFAHSTMMTRRSVLEDVGGYRAVPSEDYDLWLRLACSGAKLLRTRTPSVLYRIHPLQVTAGQDWKRASLANPLTQQAHADLSEMILGSGVAPNLSRLRGQNPSDAEENGTFIQAILAAARDLPREDRYVIQRAARKALHG